MKAYYKGKELDQTINRGGYILAPNGEVLKLRKNGKRVVRIDGEYVKASTVVKPTILREAALINQKELGKLYKVINQDLKLDYNRLEKQFKKATDSNLDRQFPSAKGAIKLATLITTTLILCMFVVVAWVVTRIFGKA